MAASQTKKGTAMFTIDGWGGCQLIGSGVERFGGW